MLYGHQQPWRAIRKEARVNNVKCVNTNQSLSASGRTWGLGFLLFFLLKSFLLWKSAASTRAKGLYSVCTIYDVPWPLIPSAPRTGCRLTVLLSYLFSLAGHVLQRQGQAESLLGVSWAIGFSVSGVTGYRHDHLGRSFRGRCRNFPSIAPWKGWSDRMSNIH